MRGTKTGTVAALVLTAGIAGCSLPEVLPLTGATTPGPSPYGVWYEQHWATNSVLLAATDEPNAEVIPTDEELDAALGTDDEANAAASGAGTPADQERGDVEVNAAIQQDSGDFDNTSPYQFPASSYAPGGPTQGASPSEVLIPPPPSGPQINPAPAPGGQIRY